jgi:hypothetical protein
MTAALPPAGQPAVRPQPGGAAATGGGWRGGAGRHPVRAVARRAVAVGRPAGARRFHGYEPGAE